MPKIKIRVESLSDMVFGLALSIGSLVLISNVSANASVSVTTIFVNILIFGFGFVIIVMTWLGYSRTISLLPVEVPSALFLNISLLFCVAIEPYLLYVLFTFPNNIEITYYSSLAYAVDIGTMFFILAGLARLVIKENSKGGTQRVHPLIVERFKRVVKFDYVIGGIFLLSALPIFWIETPIGYLRFVLWYSAFAFFFLRRRPKNLPEKTTNHSTETREPGNP
ncbi:MAG: hypothetical protein OK457_02065 [Thaumarchaeota archaeon]|nr:hypothetical protein [Nitrososphaerota archaeon]